MRVGRTIIALLVAVSVAMVPLAGTAAAGLKSAEISASQVEHDCCDHGAPCSDTSKAMDDCASTAAYAAKCFNYIATVPAEFTVASLGPALQPMCGDNLVVSQIGNPPFRPARV